MSSAPQITFLADGKRLHIQHGPTDLIIEAYGAETEVRNAYRRAAEFCDGLLDRLVSELPQLRQPAGESNFEGQVAQHMLAAVMPYRSEFITPMAAVAGAIADKVLAVMLTAGKLDKAYVNNGGDIAIWLGPGQKFTTAVVSDPMMARLAGRFSLYAGDGIGGIATSGRHGRSFSFGIADSVSVLAENAAMADAAATMIANQVDIKGLAKIKRVAANDMAPDSDLGERLVVVDVDRLDEDEVSQALAKGQRYAKGLVERNLIAQAVICLQGGICSANMNDRELQYG